MQRAETISQGICRECGGSGRIEKKSYKGSRRRSVKCYPCRGTGKVSTGYSTK